MDEIVLDQSLARELPLPTGTDEVMSIPPPTGLDERNGLFKFEHYDNLAQNLYKFDYIDRTAERHRVNRLGRNHGLVNAIHTAYNHHLVLQLRPDDIHLCILQALSAYMASHAEDVRSRFVDHAEKKKIDVAYAPGEHHLLFSGALFATMVDAMDPRLVSQMIPEYSTSTVHIKNTAAASAIAIASQYYDVSFTCGCGIPAVKLLGTEQDWDNLALLCTKLATPELFGGTELQHWLAVHLHSVVVGIRDTFAAGSSSASIVAFWSRVVCHLPYGSGNSYRVGGWINILTPYKDVAIEPRFTNPEPLRFLVTDPVTEDFGDDSFAAEDKRIKWFEVSDCWGKGYNRVSVTINGAERELFCGFMGSIMFKAPVTGRITVGTNVGWFVEPLDKKAVDVTISRVTTGAAASA